MKKVICIILTFLSLLRFDSMIRVNALNLRDDYIIKKNDNQIVIENCNSHTIVTLYSDNNMIEVDTYDNDTVEEFAFDLNHSSEWNNSDIEVLNTIRAYFVKDEYYLSLSNNIININDSVIASDKIAKIFWNDSIQNIGNYVFSKSKMSEIEFPNSLENIGEFAFSDCESLKNVIFKSNIKSIENNAFSNCALLNDITIFSRNTIISDGVFINNSDTSTNSTRIIRGYLNSTAEKYAHENGFQFIPLNDTTIVTTEVTTESSAFNTESTTVSTMNVKQTISDTTIVTSKSENNTNSHVGGTPETGEKNIIAIILTCISAAFLTVISSRQKSNLNQK